MQNFRWTLVVLMLLNLAVASALVAQPVKTDQLEAELVAERTSFTPGQPFWVALRLTMEPTWHTYWKNQGESGIPTRLTWDLPEGFVASELHWPYPIRFHQGDILSFGYKEEVFLLTEVTPPATMDEDAVMLNARAEWLSCRDICIPGRADLSLYFPVATQTPPAHSTWALEIRQSRQALPLPLPEHWQTEARWEGDHLIVTLLPEAGVRLPADTVVFFAEDRGLVDYEKTTLTANNDRLEGRFAPSPFRRNPTERMRAVLVAENGWEAATGPRAYRIDIPITGSAPVRAED